MKKKIPDINDYLLLCTVLNSASSQKPTQKDQLEILCYQMIQTSAYFSHNKTQ